jgi:hypothetical protein
MELYWRDVPWPAGPDGDYARRVLTPLIRDGPGRYMANAMGRVGVLVGSGVALPVVRVDGPPRPRDASYVVSPTTHYIDYAIREVELEMGRRPLARRVLPLLLGAFRPLFRWGRIERAVYVNNWLLSTNLYPPLPPGTLETAHGVMLRAHPDHAVVFRSVNLALEADVAGRLAALGYRRVISRQVYVLDPLTGGHRRKRSYLRDRALARRTPYEWTADLGEADVPRLKRLYDDLYLEKYSRYNPRFTEEFFRAALRLGWLEFQALRHAGRIDGVLGFVVRGGVMTTPLIGYDRSLPADTGLYRLISLRLIEESERRGLVLHQSSGAAAFKKYRGSVPAMEYSYVHDAHLPWDRQVPWRVLGAVSRHVAEPLMHQLGL